ncbi:uncharacterized protein LOC110453038 [Mizuhopecten yessoensis]|uniref:Uncharacterized protein n=1 Tax=Mizuhopecten yessoensis TaxID=6573 RepID=A0A210QI49_MIZYE|nr:uncharacterized protein LOC110453038 [Mizuhopecten yessoensis]OWF48455.1 hypothetical protein KP79_PYT17298 [Mizuhopecten yessoensis]
MWHPLLSVCVLTCLWRLSSTLMVGYQERSEFNKAIRRPLLEQVGLELKATKYSVENNPTMFNDINQCKVEISKKYYKCAECLSGKYKESNPSKVLSVSNALMSLCSYTDNNYEICQLILDHEQPFLEFIKRATKRVQQTMFSVLDPAVDAGPLLDVFQKFLSEQWASSSAADIGKAVNDAKLALQAPQQQGQRIKRSDNTDSERVRSKRWTKIVKSIMEGLPQMMKAGSKKKANPDVMSSYMKKYMHMGKGFSMPRIKRSSTRKMPEGHLRIKRWMQMVQSMMKTIAPNSTTAVNTMLGSIQKHIPWSMPARMMGAGARNPSNGESETLKCYRNRKCNAFITACASESCPDPRKNMILDVCGQSVLPTSQDITNRLKRTKDIFDAVRTKQDFIKSITYNSGFTNNYRDVSMTADLQPPNVIKLPSFGTNNMQQAVKNYARAIMKGLLPTNQSPV